MEKLDKVFDIVEPQTLPEKVIPNDTDVSNTDFQYTRENLYNIIERGQDAMEGLLQVAQET